MSKKVGCPVGKIKVWKEDMSGQICIDKEYQPLARYISKNKAEKIFRKIKNKGFEPRLKKVIIFELHEDWRNRLEISKITGQNDIPLLIC